MPNKSWLAFMFLVLISGATPAAAQEKAKGKPYKATADRAVIVTRTVLEKQGYAVVRVERVGATQVVYYRRGNNGRGKGKGPLEKLIIRTVKDRIVFEETAPSILVDIDVKLRL